MITPASPTTDLRPHYSRLPVEHAYTIAYGEAVPGALVVPVRQLGPEPLVETWAAPEGVLFGAVVVDDASDLEEATRGAYTQIIGEVREAGYPFFLRMWNYVGGVNAVEAGGERYQLFCAGRHDAFVEAGYHHDVDLPAASAVGVPGRGLTTHYLAAREPGVQVENPRQVAAYRYPRQYGPKSPSFSRATVWNDIVFVSGTSSVIGHTTVHAGDVASQLDETLRNIEAVLSRTGRSLADVVAAKTYVRHAEDYALIERRLADVFPVNLFLEAEICREDLLLEIEAVAVSSGVR